MTVGLNLISSSKKVKKLESTFSSKDKIYSIGHKAFLEHDYETAVNKLEPLAEEGHFLAQWHMGIINKSILFDIHRAQHWFRQAYKNGHPNAPYQIGVLYRNGYGVKQDHKTAIEWFFKGAELGDADALYNIHLAYDQGRGGIEKNLGNAFKYALMAAEEGHVDSQIKTGMLLVSGEGVKRDIISGYMWMEIGLFSNTFEHQPDVRGAYPAQVASFEKTKEILDSLTDVLTPEEIFTAKQLARECVAKNFKLNKPS